MEVAPCTLDATAERTCKGNSVSTVTPQEVVQLRLLTVSGHLPFVLPYDETLVLGVVSGGAVTVTVFVWTVHLHYLVDPRRTVTTMGGWDEFITYGCPWEGANCPTHTNPHACGITLPTKPSSLALLSGLGPRVRSRAPRDGHYCTLDPGPCGR